MAGALETQLRRAGKGNVLGVSAYSQFSSWVGKPAMAGTAAAWQRLSAGGQDSPASRQPASSRFLSPVYCDSSQAR